MEFDQFLVGSKWRIMEELGKKNQSASELAKVLKTSIANISQQLKLLEAYGIVKKEKTESEKRPGKPKTVYSIKKEQTFVIKIRKGSVKKLALKPFWGYDVFLNTVDLPHEEDTYYITKFCFHSEDILKYCNGMAFLKSTKETIELILSTENLEKIRKEFSNTLVKHPEGDKRKIICWSHSEKELEDGINNHEKYFLDLTKDYTIIYDREKVLEKILELRASK